MKVFVSGAMNVLVSGVEKLLISGVIREYPGLRRC